MTPSEVVEHAEALRPFATANDVRILDAIAEHGSLQAAAAALGVARSTLQANLRNLAKRGAMRGWSPEHDMTKVVPEPFVVRGTSTLYDEDGKPKLQWVKSRLDDQQVALAMRAAAEALAETLPRIEPVLPPYRTIERLLNCYTITDAHIGMLAWGKESGADWDLGIAEATLTRAFDEMVLRSPNARRCVIANLGDLLHSDSMTPVTPASGHVLDADSRFPKIVAAALRILRHMISRALLHHDEVTVLLAEGNHDTASSVWLRAMFSAIYETEPRVTVIDSPRPYYAVQHGRTMLAWHHGHLKKMEGLPLLLAAQFSEMWGATTKRYAHMGHLHHEHVKEFPGIKVVQHPTLAAKDAYAARGGWLSERQATSYTYHSEHGIVSSTVVTPEMLE